MEQQRCCDLTALVLTITAVLIQVTAVSLPFWQWTDVYEYVSGNTTQLSHSYVQGLWTICDLENGYSSCWNPSETTGWMHVVRALDVTALLLLFLVAILLTVFLACFSRNLISRIILIVLLFTCVILILAGVSVFGINADDGYLHFAFAFAVLAAVLALIAAVLLLVILLCEKSSNNKGVMNEDRAEQSGHDNEAQPKAVEKHRHMSKEDKTRPTPFVSLCDECGKQLSKGPFVDRSTSMLSLHSGKVHPISAHRPDIVTRSTCMTPLQGITNQYRHRTTPVYCGKTTPEGRFGTDQGLHGSCPHSLFCCKCQHQFPKKESKKGCDCIIGDNSICDKCKDKQIEQERKAYGHNETSEEARLFYYDDEATAKSKYVEKQQRPQSRKSEQESISKSTSVEDLSEDRRTPPYHDNNKGVKTNPIVQSKELELPMQNEMIIEEVEKPVSEDKARPKQTTLSYDDQHDVKQSKNVVIGLNDSSNTETLVNTLNENEVEHSRKQSRNSAKKVAITRKPVQSRYAFDKHSGTLPNYITSDKHVDSSNDRDDSTNRPKSYGSLTGSPVDKKSKRKNPPKRWDPPKWN